MGKSSVRIDRTKNRIYITFEGFYTVETAEALKQAYAEALGQMPPGFTVLTDAVQYRPGTAEVQEIIASMRKLAEQAGCTRVARAVGDNPLGGYQIDRLGKEETSYPSRNFKTLIEAETYLDSKGEGDDDD